MKTKLIKGKFNARMLNIFGNVLYIFVNFEDYYALRLQFWIVAIEHAFGTM